ncbi:MAG: S41 family peptidase [Gammaproteobacteria bacterium]|nr:S41 family peptidase [Gammaproteobacteria bacterium]
MKLNSISIFISTIFAYTFCFGDEKIIENSEHYILKYPDISKENIVFVHDGDIWIVGRKGGQPRRLTRLLGQEANPKFSPSGTQIAFSAQPEGNTNVYFMNLTEKKIKQATDHPGEDMMLEWYPDEDHILLRSSRYSPLRRFNKLFKLSIVDGKLPQTLPVAYGEVGCLSPDSKMMVFQTISRENRTWKRYRGGMASDLWIYNFVDTTAYKLTNFSGTDTAPMWYKDQIFFLSDRGNAKRANIWSFDLKTTNVSQITHFKAYDVKWPSIGPDAIIFENGGLLYTFNLIAKTLRPVRLIFKEDEQKNQRFIKRAINNIRQYSLSPKATHILIQERGEIFLASVDQGKVKNLTQSSGVEERDPGWGPDDQKFAYFSDRSGEYELYVRHIKKDTLEIPITRGSKTFYFFPVWAPDGEKIAYSDKAGNLFVANVKNKRVFHIDRDSWERIVGYSWSPNSRWLVYSKFAMNNNKSIFVYDFESHCKHQVTSAFYHDYGPLFSPEGDYLFFLSNRLFRQVSSSDFESWIYPNKPNKTQLFAVCLRKEVPSPLPRNVGDEQIYIKKNLKRIKSRIDIDFKGIEERIFKLPINIERPGGWNVIDNGILFERYHEAVSKSSLHFYELKTGRENLVIDDIDSYHFSSESKKVLCIREGQFELVDIVSINPADPINQADPIKLTVDSLNIKVDQRAEWKQIFNSAWRLQRDFIYDKNKLNNWELIRRKYEPLASSVTNRRDLNYIIGEMIGELSASHTYVRGGDVTQIKRTKVGLLGCDYTFDSQTQLFKISRIYKSATWDNAIFRSPLNGPGINIKEGDYLLSIDGHPLGISLSPWAALKNKVNKPVRLLFNSFPTTQQAQSVVVEPLSSESRLRYLAWVEQSRTMIDSMTGGRIGYIYIPNTRQFGREEFIRQYNAQRDKDGLIIDVRFNSGGQSPYGFINLLERSISGQWRRRDFRDWIMPEFAFRGAMILVVNEWTASAGETLGLYFRQAELGPIVGKRTWGGIAGFDWIPRFVDGGKVTVPYFAYRKDKNENEIEGYGIEPDFSVENMPHELFQGRDAQLEKALEVILKSLEVNPMIDGTTHRSHKF